MFHFALFRLKCSLLRGRSSSGPSTGGTDVWQVNGMAITHLPRVRTLCEYHMFHSKGDRKGQVVSVGPKEAAKCQVDHLIGRGEKKCMG